VELILSAGHEMWASGTFVREERCIQTFGGELEGKSHLEDPDVDGRIILKWILKKAFWW